MIDEKKLIGELNAWWETLDPRTNTRDSIICDVIESVIAKINVAEKVGEWIPCSERLPENETRVLVQWRRYFSDEIHIHILALNELGEWYCDLGCINGKAIAWQPLPEPYKEEI